MFFLIFYLSAGNGFFVNLGFELLKQDMCCKVMFDSISKSLSNQNHNDFEIESNKYHRKIVVLFLKARILSLQDVVFRTVFFLYFVKISAGNGF